MALNSLISQIWRKIYASTNYISFEPEISRPADETLLMRESPSVISGLARELITLELARNDSASSNGAALVCERLRSSLSRLGGVAGFRSLLARAVALAKVEEPLLNPVTVDESGTIHGLDSVGGDAMPEIAIVAFLLGLLKTFVGESLMLQLVRDCWPEAKSNTLNGKAGESL